MQGRAVGIVSDTRLELAHRIVQLCPGGVYKGFRLGLRVGTLQVVEYDRLGLPNMLSVEKLAKELGIWTEPVKVEKPVDVRKAHEKPYRLYKGCIAVMK
jgi:hypothetical protein